MKIIKLISIVLCVVLILGNTLTYANAEDFDSGSTNVDSEVQTTVEPVFDDINVYNNESNDSEIIATSSDIEEDVEVIDGNYAEEPEVSEVSISENTTEVEETSISLAHEVASDIVQVYSDVEETSESIDISSENPTEDEIATETLSDNLESTSSESLNIAENSEPNIENSDDTATTSEASEMSEETTDASFVVQNNIEAIIVGDEVVSTASELNIKSIELATASTLTSETLFGEVATNSDMDFTFKFGSNKVDYIPKRVKTKYHQDLLRTENLPSSYDSRNVGGVSYVPPIRNQKPFGTCWAFSMIGQSETSAIKKGLVPDNNSINLSEAALAYFMLNLKNITAKGSENIDYPGLEGNDRTDGIYDEHGPSWADRGGSKMLAAMQVSSYMGLVKENADTSYDRVVSYEHNIDEYTLDGKYAFNSNDFEIKNIQLLHSSDLDIIKKAIMDNGSVGISYFASAKEDREKSDHEINGELYFCSNNTLTSNHDIMVIGWDDSIPKENFYYGNSYSTATHKVNRDGAWLCRNSWGDTYGNEGYFWISYDESSFANGTFSSIEVMPANTYEYNYHYDTTGNVMSDIVSDRIGNVYKVSDDKNQTLDAISIAVDDTNAVFDVEIYTSDTNMTNPTQGIKQLTQRANINISGVWTIPLNKKVLLKKGTYFSIVLKPVSDTICFFVDKNSNYYWCYCYNEAALGQSFEYTGTSWSDLNTEMKIIDGISYGKNWRIKGLTNPSLNITFDAGGGSGTMDIQGAISGEATKLDANKFTRTGYRFNGWIDEDGHTYANRSEITITNDITLTAMWVKNGGGGGDGGGGGGSDGYPVGISLDVAQTTLKNAVSKPEVTQSVDASLVTWTFDVNTNKFKLTINANGQSTAVTNGFIAINSVETKIVNGVIAQVPIQNTYYFDVESSMVTGWVKTMDNKTYFFENAKTADEGKMATGWKMIQGSWYYFQADGAMLVNATTPDGYLVGSDGKMMTV